MVDNQHWLDRWREDRIGFHEADVNPYLKIYLPRLGLAPGSRIFVPLCGKARDLAWLARQGFEVVGIELARIAIEAFFAEQSLQYQRSHSDRFVIYRSGPITLLEGDFFDLRAEDLEDCVLAYDRAALIAMEAPDRPDYYRHMLSIFPASGNMLLITLEYDPAEMRGPPFAAWEEEVRRYYAGAFSIDLLERNSIIDERPRWRKVGLTALDEVVYLLHGNQREATG